MSRFSLLSLLNTCLKRDPLASHYCQALQHHSVHLELISNAFNPSICFVFSDNGIEISEPLLAPSVFIQGSMGSFLTYLRTRNIQKALQQGLKIEGDAETLQHLNALFQTFTIDWEEQLSYWTHDIVAHHLSQGFQSILKYTRRSKHHLAQDLRDYLTEESHTLPPSFEAETWMTEVDTLRSDVERLQCRVERLSAFKKEDH